MSERDEYDSDAPEEFTSEQGIQIDEEIRKVQRESIARIAQEGKDRRRKWTQNKTPRPSRGGEVVQNVVETETPPKFTGTGGMLPDEIVKVLAAREKKVFFSDSDEEETQEKPLIRKKKAKNYGPETVILKDIPPAQCLANSLEFLKKRKMQVSRSDSILNNSNQALRLLSTSGLLTKK